MENIINDSEYELFIKKYFPYSNLIDNADRKLIYFRVCENNIITEIYEKYCKNRKLKCHLLFLKKYREQFNKILIYIALNEPSGIEFCIRSTIEYLLKFLYSIYFEKTFDNISKTSFRNIKDDFKKLDTDIFLDKNIINSLLRDYGTYSNSIHGKKTSMLESIEYMENIIKLKNYNLSNLDKTLIRIIDNYEILMFSILEISECDLSVAEKIRLKKSLTNKRFNKVEKYFYK